MNRINTYINTLMLALVFAFTANANTSFFSVNDKFSDQEIESQILQLSADINLVYNSEVKTLINTYISAGRKNTEVILSRSQYYFPLMEKLIEEHQLPEELKYLSVIESGLRPKVKSSVGATGLWQFMSSTAKQYNLRIHSTVDDRKDVKKSTEAAMLYLADLYDRFGDWTLALAAYNCGPGNINKAIRKSGGKKDFWEIRKYLPKETRRYLPKLIATIYVMNHFESYGLTDKSQKFSEHNAFGLAQIFSKTSFDHISKNSGLTIKELQKYNPSYSQNYIPASTNGNNLIMPETYLLTYLQNKQMMQNLKDVFYLKSAIVRMPQKFVEPIKVERESLAVELLNRIDLELLDVENPTLKVEHKPLFSYSTDIEKTYRLRKRQTLAVFIEENKIDSSLYNISVNQEGVVRLFKK